MIEQGNTPHGVWYRVVHGSNSMSSDDEESVVETTATTVPLIPTPAPVTAAIPPPPLTVTLSPSIPPVIEECLNHFKEG